ncbi:hypothetical protein PVAND_001115 [Polypedilum vanderplanki]|uniref:Chitin-binding type-2 domain-containing protein n=1 Tax=Polypedilum vanderplanki TaxID=319348 RepID=A0A9J6BN75_POLVA|nr:hypothetical protein PVAND_001115 [Polypedilum vanderplanki]
MKSAITKILIASIFFNFYCKTETNFVKIRILKQRKIPKIENSTETFNVESSSKNSLHFNEFTSKIFVKSNSSSINSSDIVVIKNYSSNFENIEEKVQEKENLTIIYAENFNDFKSEDLEVKATNKIESNGDKTNLTTEENSTSNIKNKQIISSTSTESTEILTRRGLIISGTCLSEGFSSHQNDCHKFHICLKTNSNKLEIYTYECNYGTAWNQKLFICELEENIRECSVTKLELITKRQEMTSEIEAVTTEEIKNVDNSEEVTRNSESFYDNFEEVSKDSEKLLNNLEKSSENSEGNFENVSENSEVSQEISNNSEKSDENSKQNFEKIQKTSSSFHLSNKILTIIIFILTLLIIFLTISIYACILLCQERKNEIQLIKLRMPLEIDKY